MGDEYPFGCALPEMDVEAFLNIRDWLEKALVAAGAKITDAGVGMGQADLGFQIDGMPYGVSIKPRPLPAPPHQGRE